MFSSTVISSYMPLITMILIRATLARELRPSDHGLEYQSPPPSSGKTSPQMRSFFKVPSSFSSSSSTSTPSTPTNVALPRAMNSSDTSWLTDGSGSKDHVRHVMLVASLVCGVTGVALLVASALLYFFRFRNRQLPSSSCVNNNNNNNNNSNNSKNRSSGG